MRQGFDVEPTLVQDKVTGTFDVLVNGELVFSKLETGRFPNTGEVTQIIKDRGLSPG